MTLKCPSCTQLWRMRYNHRFTNCKYFKWLSFQPRVPRGREPTSLHTILARFWFSVACDEDFQRKHIWYFWGGIIKKHLKFTFFARWIFFFLVYLNEYDRNKHFCWMELGVGVFSYFSYIINDFRHLNINIFSFYIQFWRSIFTCISVLLLVWLFIHFAVIVKQRPYNFHFIFGHTKL